MSIQNAFNTALYSKLTSYSALTSLLSGTAAIYFMQAPDGSTLPYVVWDIVDDPDTNYTANRNVIVLAFIRGYASTPSLAGSIDAQIYNSMMEGISVSGWTNFWKAREDGFHLVENEPNGTRSYMAGAHYRLSFDKD